MSGGENTILRPGGFFGAYRVVSLLGKGGMGEVYLVEDPAHGCARYAVKALAAGATGGDGDFLKRFVREAEFAMKVRHPNLVEVYDAGIDPDTGICYLTMEYMPGGSLKDLLAGDGIMSIPGVCTIATDIARALVLVQANGMVHRDVKPDNILFSADGTAKLTDLGITRFAYGSDVAATRADGVVGTPAYMAPEQMLDPHSVDIRADIYSLGIVMYEMITGHRPNEGDDALHALAKALDGQSFADVRTRRADAPACLAELVHEMTLPRREERPQSARQVLERLAHLERRTGGAAPHLRSAAVHPPWYQDRGVLYALTAMVLAFEALVVALNTVLRRG
ncbi:MAG: serine/threonine-protein kinase [Kiritimatiellia bacterium]